MIRLIVSDIDGTLVEDGGNSLKPEICEVILKLAGRGIRFVAASGRHAAGMHYLFRQIRDEISYISDNGAFIEYAGEVHTLQQYDRRFMGPVIDDLRALGLDLMIDGPDRVYTDSQNEEFVGWLRDGYHFQVGRLADAKELDDPFVKISGCRMSGISDAEANRVAEKYAGSLKVTLAGSQWLDTFNPAVNKGNTLRFLQEKLGIAPDETMVFGDQLNDIEMLGRAYYSFSVANGRPETRAAARFLADTNLKDGVYKILRLL